MVTNEMVLNHFQEPPAPYLPKRAFLALQLFGSGTSIDQLCVNPDLPMDFL